MNVPLQITFRGMESSEALAERIREAALKLEKFEDRIVACRVLVEQPHRHHQQGNHFHLRIQLTIPGNELVVSHEHKDAATQENAYAAVADACEAMKRRLQEKHRKLIDVRV